MEDLSKLRQDIDRIDRQIVELFEERMGVSRQVAEYKIANGKKVLDRRESWRSWKLWEILPMTASTVMESRNCFSRLWL